MADTIVIEWDRDRLIATSGSASRSSVTLSRIAVVDKSDTGLTPAELGHKLNAALTEAEISTEAAIVLLPRQQVTFHRIQLPQVPDEEVPGIVRLQAATRLTVPVDSVCLDFAPLPVMPGDETREVLLVTVPQKNIDDIRKTLAACSIELSGVRVSSFGIAASVAHAGLLPRESGQTIEAVVCLRADMIEMIFLKGHAVIFSHSGASWASSEQIEQAVRSEISRARMAASEEIKQYTVSRLTLIGSDSVTGVIPDSVSQRLDDAVIRRIDPENTLLSAPSHDSVTSSDLLGCAGVIANLQHRPIEAVDLVNPRKAPEKKDNRRVKILLTTGAIVIALVGGWQWRTNKVADLESRTRAINGDVSRIQQELRSKATRSELQLDERIAAWRDRDVDWLAEMRRIRELMGSTERVIVRRFDFGSRSANHAGTVRIEGFAKSRDDVERLMRILREANYDVSQWSIERTSRDADYPTELTLDLSIPIPSSEDQSQSA